MALALKDHLLERTSVYRAWQAPFAGGKFKPVLQHNDLAKVRRVLDVGCGPGTNTSIFDRTDYLGVDINPRYIDYARRHHQARFLVADATELDPAELGTFDFVLVNSFLHHMSDEAAAAILRRLAPILMDGGHIHVLDLVLPAQRNAARMLANLDRGDHPRPLERWHELFRQTFDEIVFEPFGLGLRNLTLWEMVYFKGTRRRAS